MITVFPSSSRGHVDYGWLDTRHSFSFGNWHNPDRMGFHALRVINEDRIAADTGFGKHFHDNMEIITYVYEGALTHADNSGGGGVIRRGDVQHMSAGRGIIHGEFNKSPSEECRLLQIWLIPDRFDIPPAYDQKHFTDAAKTGVLLPIASGDGRDGSLVMQLDAAIYASILPAGASVGMPLAPGRHAWLQVISGHIDVNGTPLTAGDGAEVDNETLLQISALEQAEFLAFDLAA